LFTLYVILAKLLYSCIQYTNLRRVEVVLHFISPPSSVTLVQFQERTKELGKLFAVDIELKMTTQISIFCRQIERFHLFFALHLEEDQNDIFKNHQKRPNCIIVDKYIDMNT